MFKKLLTSILCCLVLLQCTPLLAQTSFTNRSKSYGVIDAIACIDNTLIATNTTDHIIMSTNQGASWQQVAADNLNFKKIVQKDNVILAHGQSYNPGIALYQNGKWQTYRYPNAIASIGATPNGFTLLQADGVVLTSPSGLENTWTTVTTGAKAFSGTIRKMCYINGSWAVLGNDSILYTTKDFKTKNALPYTVVRDILLQDNKLFLVSEAKNNPIITLDASFKEVAVSPTTKDRSITDKGSYYKLVSLNDTVYAVGVKGGIVDCNKTLVGTIDTTFYPFPTAVCTDGTSFYVADQGTGLIRYHFATQTTTNVLANGEEKFLYQVGDELWALNGSRSTTLYRINKDGTITSFPNVQEDISLPEGFFKRGADYVLRDAVGKESLSKDLINWSTSEDRIVVDDASTDIRDNGMTLWRLKMSNPIKIGDLLYYILEDDAGTKTNTALTCILDVAKTEAEQLVSNDVALTIMANGKEVQLGGTTVTIRPTTDKSHTPNRSTKTDRLVVLPEKKGETTLNAFSLGIGRIQTIVPFKDNLLAVGGENGKFMLLEQRKVGNTIEIIYKDHTQFKIPSYDPDVKHIYATPDTLYLAVNRDVYWSKDGMNWENSFVSYSPELINAAIRGIAYGNGTCMVICNGSEAFYSKDMKTWQYIDVAPGQQLQDISFTGNNFVITTFEGGLWVGTP
ncbi:MAG: hypothetical protein ACRDDX_14745 [Cellulosilyticaceae bacterium]